MTSFSLAATLDLRPAAQPAVLYDGWRKPHDTEIRNYDLNDVSGYDYMAWTSGKVRDAVINSAENPEQRPMPEVYRISDFQTLLSCGWVRLWRDLNPTLSVKRFSTLLDNKLAWTNGTGVTTRYNCLTGENAGAKDPAFHACIINGGAYLQGDVVGDYLYVETLRTGNPVPPAEWVLARPWLWFYGTAITKEGRVNYITRLDESGQYTAVRVPLVTSQLLRVPVRWLQRWQSASLPDALKVYS